MKNPAALKIIAASAIYTCASAVFSHESHAMAGSHWHGDNSGALVTVAVIAALAISLIQGRRGGKK